MDKHGAGWHTTLHQKIQCPAQASEIAARAARVIACLEPCSTGRVSACATFLLPGLSKPGHQLASPWGISPDRNISALSEPPGCLWAVIPSEVRVCPQVLSSGHLGHGKRERKNFLHSHVAHLSVSRLKLKPSPLSQPSSSPLWTHGNVSHDFSEQRFTLKKHADNRATALPEQNVEKRVQWAQSLPPNWPQPSALKGLRATEWSCEARHSPEDLKDLFLDIFSGSNFFISLLHRRSFLPKS